MRTRAAVLVAIALTASACGRLITVSEEVEAGPEVFEFVMEQGSGPGPQAEEMAAELGGDEAVIPGSANHIADVMTPRGLTRFVTYTAAPTDETPLMSCIFHAAPHGGGGTCGPPGSVGGNRSMIDGFGEGQGWTDTTVYAPEGATLIQMTTADGTVFTIVPVNGIGYALWPSGRGLPVKVVAFNEAGEVIAEEDVRTF